MASKIKVDQLETVDGTGNITVNQPLSGSGAGLTSLPAANLTGSLPAISGASLTGIPAANITGVIPAANLGTGTASSSTFLNGSGAYSEAGGGAWNVITSQEGDTSAYVSFETGIDSTYDQYCFIISNCIASAGSANFQLQLKFAGESSFTASNYQYKYGDHDSSSENYSGRASTSSTVMQMADNGYKCSMRLWLHDPSDTVHRKFISWEGAHSDSGGKTQINTGGGSNNAHSKAITGVRFYFTSGGIVSGRITLYGIAHA